MRYLAASVLLSGLLVLAQGAGSQTLAGDASARHEVATVFVDRSAVGKNVTDYVAKVGKPDVVSIEPGESIGDVVKRQCGRLDPNYLSLVRQHLVQAQALPATADATTRFAEAHLLTLPSCLRLPADEAGLDGSSLAQFLDLYAPLLGGSPTRSDANAAGRDVYAKPVSTSPTLAEEIGWEYRPWDGASTPAYEWTAVTLRHDAGPAQAAQDHLLKLLVANGQQPASAAGENRHDLRLYSALTISQLSAGSACQCIPGQCIPDGRPAALFADVTQMTEVLAASLRKRGSPPAEVKILIPDTGLEAGGGQTTFPNERMVVEEWDGNPLQPNASYPFHQHGTNVATLALGGPSFMQILGSMTLNLHVVPVNLICDEGTEGRTGSLNKLAFANSIQKAAQQSDRFIVNPSVGQEDAMPAVKVHLNATSPLLFVVAAGNESADLANKPVYPARYGGDNAGRYNLITVAALDLDGHKAGFSNYGADYVDIGAPGCRQPVLEFDASSGSFNLVEASGTSFAAPNVSFVAALLEATLRKATPQVVKRRILASADIVPELLQQGIADGRRLNPVKALAVYEDVVEALVDGKRTLIHGVIDESSAPFEFCSGSLSLFLSGDNQPLLKKLARRAAPTPEFLIYYLTADGELKPRLCPPDSLRIKIRDSFSNRLYDLGEEEIIDVVTAEHPG